MQLFPNVNFLNRWESAFLFRLVVSFFDKQYQVNIINNKNKRFPLVNLRILFLSGEDHCLFGKKAKF